MGILTWVAYSKAGAGVHRVTSMVSFDQIVYTEKIILNTSSPNESALAQLETRLNYEGEPLCKNF